MLRGYVWDVFPCSIDEETGEVSLTDSWVNGMLFDVFNEVLLTVMRLFVEYPLFRIRIKRADRERFEELARTWENYEHIEVK